MHDRIGRAVVRYGFRYMRRRYRRQVRIAALGAAVLAVGAAVYLASREVPEG